MGNSKKDLHRRKANLKSRLEELEKQAKMDPLKRNKSIYVEMEDIKKKLSNMDV